MTDFTICYWFHFHYHHTVMSLMSYCTDADDCSLVYPTTASSSHKNNDTFQDDNLDDNEGTRKSNAKSKSNCSNIRNMKF